MEDINVQPSYLLNVWKIMLRYEILMLCFISYCFEQSFKFSLLEDVTHSKKGTFLRIFLFGIMNCIENVNK